MRAIQLCVLVVALAHSSITFAAPTDPDGNRAHPSFTPQQFASHTSTPFTPAWQPFGPTGADAKAIAASPTVANVRIAGVSDSFGGGSLYRSGDDGASWQAAMETGSRGVNDVAFAINGNAYAATQDGLFKSIDNGLTWTRLDLPGTDQDLVMSIATDPANAQVVWIGLGQFLNGAATQLVLRSTDGGTTWNNFSPAFAAGMGVTKIAIDPANNSRIAVAFTGNFGAGNDLWITTNGGTSWSERSAGLPNNILYGLAFAGGTLYVSGGQDFGSQFVGLFKTTDNGVNWTEVSDLSWPNRSVTAVAVDPNNPQKIFVGTQRAGLGISTNGGTSWTFSAGGTGNFPVNDIVFVQNNSNNIFLAMGAIAVLHSTNGGTSFTSAANGFNRLNVSSIAVNPLNSNEIAMAFVGDNNGGIFTSTNAGQSWTLDPNAPLPRWQYLTFGPDGVLYGTHDGPLGRADDGLWIRNANGTWQDLGPGGPSQLDTQGKSIAVSSGTPKVILLGGTEGFFNGYDAVINTYNRLGNGQWEKSYESGAIQNEYVSSLVFLNNGAGPEAVASMVNFGFENGGAGGILRSTNTGQSWARSETGYPAGWHAWGLSNRPSAPNTLYTEASQFTFSNLNNRVYRSSDGGQSWEGRSFADTMPFRQMIVDPLLPNTLYGANLNNGAPMISENDGGTFNNFNAGLIGQGGPGALITGGNIRKLYYGTSSGAFSTPIRCPADFNGDNIVDFFDYLDFVQAFSSNAPSSDFNADGVIDFFDYLDFVAAFNTTC